MWTKRVGKTLDLSIELCFVNLKRNQALLESNLPGIRLMIYDNRKEPSGSLF